MANARKGMVVLIVLGVVFAVGLAVVGGITAYRQYKEKKADDDKGDQRHEEIVTKLDGLKSALAETKKDESLEAQLRVDYPYGYVLYGYENGVTSFVPIEPKGATKISCDPTSIKLERDSDPTKFILKVGKVQYYRTGTSPVTLNIQQFEWKFPADDEHPYETTLLAENGRVFSLMVELINQQDDRYVFVLAFVVRDEHDALRRRQENGVLGTPGFYERRLDRLRRNVESSRHEEIGKALCSLGDALCQVGRVEAGLKEFRKGIEMLEKVASPALDAQYGNFAWDLAHYGKYFEQGIVFAKKSKALYQNRSAVDDPAQLGVNSTLAYCLVELGRKPEAVPLFRENLLATLVQFYRDKRTMGKLEIAAKNYAHCVVSDHLSMKKYEDVCRALEKEAYQKVHGSLKGYEPLLNFTQNPEFKGFE